MTEEVPRRFRIAYPRPYWYVACPSRELRSGPLARTMLDVPLVLFRGPRGVPGALVDRCAHRNLPLSVGRVAGGELECAYHGWRFDPSGRCRHVPALVDVAERRGRTVASYPVVEQQGYVWVYAQAGAPPEGTPPLFPYLDTPGYGFARFEAEVDATLYATLENMLDVPHTSFLHRGLFRQSPRRSITAIVRRAADRVEAEYVGESRPGGLVGRILAPRAGRGPGEPAPPTVEHYDRFSLPSIAQVEYRLGNSHLVITNAATPVTDFRTRFFSVFTFRLPVPAALVRAVLSPIVRRIFRQDAWILRLQTEAVRRAGRESFVSTEADVLGPHIWRLLREAADGRPTSTADEATFETRIELRT
jgi:phenylpropionate dioxygenase-like ring-hydroxylating dioxygenase large terminal subunit